MKTQFGYSISWSSFEDIISKSCLAEKFGFDSIWYHDHLMIPSNAPVLESFSLLTALADRTNHCKIGQTVVDTSRRHPVTIAHSALTINHISNGRAFVGLGTGEAMNLTPLQLSMERPLKRLRESLKIVKGVFNAKKEKPFSFSGDIFSVKDVFLKIDDESVLAPPIYVGAGGPRTREITGELADGWIPYVHSLSNYGKFVEDIKKGVEKTKRNISELDLVASVPVLITDNKNENVHEKIGRSLAIRLLLEGNTLKDLGWQEEVPKEILQSNMIIDESITKRLEVEADKIPFEMTEQIAAIGTPSEIIEILEKYKKIGANHFLIKFLGKVTTDDFQKFDSKIVQVMNNT